MRRRILDHEALVAFNPFENGGLFDRPFPYISPLFSCLRIFLLCMRWLPPRIPAICKLLQEWGFELGWLDKGLARKLAEGKMSERVDRESWPLNLG